MIQLTAQTLPGLFDIPRPAVRVPTMTSDFALALAGLVAPAPVAAGVVGGAVAPYLDARPDRQIDAVDGNVLPVEPNPSAIVVVHESLDADPVPAGQPPTIAPSVPTGDVPPTAHPAVDVTPALDRPEATPSVRLRRARQPRPDPTGAHANTPPLIETAVRADSKPDRHAPMSDPSRPPVVATETLEVTDVADGLRTAPAMPIMPLIEPTPGQASPSPVLSPITDPTTPVRAAAAGRTPSLDAGPSTAPAATPVAQDPLPVVAPDASAVAAPAAPAPAHGRPPAVPMATVTRRTSAGTTPTPTPIRAPVQETPDQGRKAPAPGLIAPLVSQTDPLVVASAPVLSPPVAPMPVPSSPVLVPLMSDQSARAAAGLLQPATRTSAKTDGPGSTAAPLGSAAPPAEHRPPVIEAAIARILAASPSSDITAAPVPPALASASAGAGVQSTTPAVAGQSLPPAPAPAQPPFAGSSLSLAGSPAPADLTARREPDAPHRPSPPPLAPTAPVAQDPVAVVAARPAAQAFAAAMFAAAERPAPRRGDAAAELAAAFPLAGLGTATPVSPIAVQPVTAPQAPPLDTSTDEWLGAMIDRIETLRDESAGVRETRIRLSPDALGTLDVAIRQEGDSLTVRIAAETPAARAILADAAPRLNELAEARGLKLAGSGVETGAGGNAFADRQQRQPDAPIPAQPRSAANDGGDHAAPSTDIRIA